MDNIRRYTANNLKLIDKFHSLILKKIKTSTIRLGYVFFINEIIEIKFQAEQDIKVRLLSVDYSKCLKDLTDIDAQKDGFNDVNELKEELLLFYNAIDDNTQFTIVNFKLIE